VSAPVVARTRAELAAARAALGGDGQAVALVPTMGALHDGHRALIRHAGTVAGDVVVSVFVNPLQFAPGEDLDRYPRTFDADLEMCAAEGVALVFAPDVAQMYPIEPAVRVCAGDLATRFEGASRPGHFDGVLTVVTKLLGLVRPDVAVFGEKDAQQLALVRRLVADLELGVRIDAVPVVRDADGLALSSRNRYLTGDERRAALALPRTLGEAARAAAGGAAPDVVRRTARAALATADGVELDYVDVVGEATFAPVGQTWPEDEPARAVAAVRIGRTRLIDTIALRRPATAAATGVG
jgi:pantoate--beta-alanine ligase